MAWSVTHRSLRADVTTSSFSASLAVYLLGLLQKHVPPPSALVPPHPWGPAQSTAWLLRPGIIDIP